MHKELSKYMILLGSKSPRREDLLKQSGLLYKKVFIDIDENIPLGMNPPFAAMYLADKKSMSFSKDIKNNEILLTSDTIVVLDEKILNKAANHREAKTMLNDLSGKSHQVITAVCLRGENKKHVFYDTSNVFFNDLNEEDIDYYIENFKPFDKAGAYGIQEWIGLTNIKRIEGSYYNIVGLPLNLILEVLKKW